MPTSALRGRGRTPGLLGRSAGWGPWVGLGVVVAGCAMAAPVPTREVGPAPEAAAPLPALLDGPVPGVAPAAAVPAPPPFRGGVRSADVVVVGSTTLPASLRRRIATTPGVGATASLAMASAPVGGRMVTLGAVDPATYRGFTPSVTARADAVWQRVADGDLAVSPALAAQTGLPLGGQIVLGNAGGALTLRIGAEASMAPGIDAVLNHVRGRQLGMPPDNAVLVSVRGEDLAEVAQLLRARVGSRATVSLLGEALPRQGEQTAFLTGGSVAEAVGSFSYRYRADGSVEPDPTWVAANLRTEQVPILGTVTCHRVMLPQLRGALEDVVTAGLAGSIDAGDFGGCYAPRFIDHDPSQGLSLHTWGIAVDLNVQGNLRGTSGELDRRVVDIFKRWGFAWGGDWAYTDPMHFELAGLVRPR